MSDATPSDFYARLDGLQFSALSWNGFNLFGDSKSIEEVRRLMFQEARANALEQRLREMMQHRAVVPEGWKLVPVEPVREMWAASGTAIVRGGWRHHDRISEDVWNAMLAAAPPPPAPAVEPK